MRLLSILGKDDLDEEEEVNSSVPFELGFLFLSQFPSGGPSGMAAAAFNIHVFDDGYEGEETRAVLL